MENNKRALHERKLKALLGTTAALLLLVCVFLAVYGVYGWAFITTQQVKNYKADLYARASENAEGGGVAFLGDSLTEMYDLEKHYPDLKVYNRGISGDTTDHMLDRLESNVLALHPDVIVFLGGCNDIRHGTPVEEVTENIASIIARIKSALPGTPVIVQSLYPLNTNAHGIFKNTPGQCTVDKLQSANEQIKALCAEYDVVFADIYPLLAAEDGNIRLEYVLPDNLHLRPGTYDIVTNALTPLIKAALSAGDTNN